MSNRADATDMKQAKKRELKPKLRFPEFRDAPGWAQESLIDTCERISQGGTPDTSNPDYWNGSIEWLTPAEMGKTETRFIQSTARKITKKGLNNCSSDLLPINSVIISTRAPIGHLAINKSEMAINQGCKCLVPRESTNYDFLYYSLLKFKTSLTDLGAGNTFKELTGNSLKNFEIPFPTLSEQQKIADCLSSIDDRISAEAQKLDTLKAHKKGLMQQLFPAEGETLPKLRFPEFRDNPEWEIKPLGVICDVKGGKRTPKGSSLTTENTGYPYIRVSDMYMGGVNISSVLFITEEVERLIRIYKISKDDLFITVAGTIGLIGEIPEELDNANLTENADKIVIKNVVKKYLLHYLSADLTQNLIINSVTNNAQPKLALEQIRSFPMLIPSWLEQQKIADCLSFLDELITAQTQKIDTLKIHKKGLMQQLFPSLDEVQG